MVRALRAYLTVEASEPLTVFTGQLVKTLVYTVYKNIRVFHMMRGIISPVHISPLFKPGRGDYTLGDLVTPLYEKKDEEVTILPVQLTGEEYVVHIGGDPKLVGEIQESLEKLRTPLAVKFGDSIVTFRLEKAEDITNLIKEKELAADRVTVYLKGPARLFNIFTASRLPKFNISACEVLMTGYMIHRGEYTITESLVIDAMRVLGLLVETYYSLNTVKPILVPFKGKEPAMIGKITYIVDSKDKIQETIAEVLNNAEIVGIGESRQNGFGTVTWKQK